MKKMFAVLVVLVGFLTIGSGVQAQKTSTTLKECQAWQRIQSFEDANGDTSHFSIDEWTAEGLCVGYVDGWADGASNTLFTADGIVYQYVLRDFTVKQLINAFVAYATAHPESLDQYSAITIIGAAGAAGMATKNPIGKLVPMPASGSPSPVERKQTAQNKM